jgi:DNA-binding GntR family transcriptional regulator
MSLASPSLPPDNDAGLSASRRAYGTLRERIINMELLPGTRIVEKDIAAEFGISRTPVHEAVQRLAEEGLIEVVPRVGTFVARIPLDALDEAMLVRSALETAIVQKAAERADATGLARLQAILDEQAACIGNKDIRGFHRTDEAFHAALAELSGYPGVWPMVSQAKTQVDRFRQLTLPLEGRMEEVIREHRSVVDAVASRDPQQAVLAMQSHLDHVLPVLEVTRKLRPEFFTAPAEARAAACKPPPPPLGGALNPAPRALRRRRLPSTARRTADVHRNRQAASRAARPGQPHLPCLPRSRCDGQMAAALRLHLQGGSDGRARRRPLPHVLHQLRQWANPCLRRRIPGTRAGSADPLYRQVRQPRSAR